MSATVPPAADIDEIKRMEKEERTRRIAEHNLYVSFQETRRVRNAIKAGRIWELAELRARGHPALLRGFNVIKKHRKLLEHYEPLSRKSSLGTGMESFDRPMVTRALKRSKSCFVSGFSCQSFVPCPAELRYTYPFGQTIMPYTKNTKSVNKGNPSDEDIVRAIARMQFGEDAERALFDGELEFVKSRRNDRIRNVLCDGEHVLSLRAEDGYFTLKLGGGGKLLSLSYPRMRVVVSKESEDPVREGKNVFARFVADADRSTIVGNEVIVVSEDDDLLAVGRALMVREEMLAFKKGMAVKVRGGIA
jgi:7-cyano-7-deazaguanine tRNA-ribosyltransferase